MKRKASTYYESEEEEEEANDYEPPYWSETVEARSSSAIDADSVSSDPEAEPSIPEWLMDSDVLETIPDHDETLDIVGSTTGTPLASTTGVCSTYAVPRSPAPNNTNTDIVVWLTDLDILYCCICPRYLTIPVFQCANGHNACSHCIESYGRCPSCSSPIGEHRNDTIEKVLKSAKTPCENKQYGCPEIVNVLDIDMHKEECEYVPYSCPFSGCNFKSELEQMSMHIANYHSSTLLAFRFDHSFDVELEYGGANFVVLQEESGKDLFVLHRCFDHRKTVFWVSRVPPLFSKYHKEFKYSVDIEIEDLGLSLSLKTITGDRGEVHEDGFPLSGYLVAPTCSHHINVLELNISSYGW